MLTLNVFNRTINSVILSLLFFISFSAFHATVSADTKSQIAEEYRALGYAEQQKGNWYGALAYYNKAISFGSGDAVIYNDVAILYEQIRFPSKAEKYYLLSIQADGNYLPPYLNLAYLCLNQGDESRAFEYFRQRYERADPSDPWGRKAGEELIRIRPEYRNRIVAKETDRLRQELVQRYHEQFDNRVRRAQEHHRTGEKLAARQRYDQAIEEFDQALQWTPENPKVIRARQKTMSQLRKKDAEEQLDRAMQSLRAGDTRSAKSEIQKTLATIPDESF